jgi:FHA domain
MNQEAALRLIEQDGAPMTDSREDMRRPPHVPLGSPARGHAPGRSRRRWAIAAGVAGGWVLMYIITGSLTGATALLLLLAAIGAGVVVALRLLGFTREHPWVRGAASRPWRDGQDVLQLALRHLPEVFVVTPNGALLAPNAIELRLNQRDYDSLAERIDIGLVGASAAEVYAEQVAAHEARFAGYGPPEVTVICDPAVPPGRFQLRQGRPLGAAPRSAFQPPSPQVNRPAGEWQFAHDGSTAAAPVSPAVPAGGLTTVAEPVHHPVPLLRLRTGDYVSQTRASGARAGRGAVELALPDVPTVSREHARFTYSDGQWWIANLGLNGLILNGSPLAGEHPLHDGDSIQWGQNQDAPQSRVEIG